MNAAILFEPDGYLLNGPRLMGRQSAGNGFLRAAVQGRGDGPVTAYTPSSVSAEVFRRTVAEIDASAETAWIPAARTDLLAQAGVLYRPDQILGPTARLRLRAGPAAYSLCGVTHTLATSSTLDAIAKIAVEPVMPWDALVCTSVTARAVVSAVLDQEAEHQRWLTGGEATKGRPLLPIIPLGVHCSDFVFSQGDRDNARRTLGLGADDVAVLFAGRLSVSGKLHPYAMFHALQSVAADTGQPIVLVVAGQAATEDMANVFRSGLTTFCPDVRSVFVDGKDADAYRRAWMGADLFLSLADSIQETFGITPVEAMAAGLPALVSDWNGYKDTVRDGVDGFRIPTWAPPPSAGGAIALEYEVGASGYEQYLSRANTAVALDMGQLRARLADLVSDPGLRRRMGAAGQAWARSAFDWPVVFLRYQALWDEQTAIRKAAASDPSLSSWLSRAPSRGADHMGPFDTFASYPTRQVSARTLVSAAPGSTPESYRALVAHLLLSLWVVAPALADRVLAALATGPVEAGDLANAVGLPLDQTTEIVARLAKIGVVTLKAGPDGG